jgi:hypothetical protein
VAGGTFLSLIPLLTEAEAPFYVSSIPLHHSKFTRDIWVILDPAKKRHYQQLKIIVVVYPLGYHHRPMMLPTFPSPIINVSTSRPECFVKPHQILFFPHQVYSPLLFISQSNTVIGNSQPFLSCRLFVFSNLQLYESLEPESKSSISSVVVLCSPPIKMVLAGIQCCDSLSRLVALGYLLF